MSEENLGLNITSTGDITAIDQLISALQRVQESGGTLAGSMSDLAKSSGEGEKAFGTLQQALSEVKRQEADVEPAQRMIQALQDAKTNGEDLTSALNRLKDEGGQDFDALQEAADEAAGGMEEAGEKSGNAFGSLLEKLPGVHTLLRWFKTGLQEAGEALKRMADEGNPGAIDLERNIATLKETTDDLKESMLSGLIPVANDATAALNNLASAGKTAAETHASMTEYAKAWAEANGVAYEDTRGWVDKTLDAIKEGFSSTRDIFDMHKGQVEQVAGSWAQLQELADRFPEAAGQIADLNAVYEQNKEKVQAANWYTAEANKLLAEYEGRVSETTIGVGELDGSLGTHRAMMNDVRTTQEEVNAATIAAAAAAEQEALARQWEADAIRAVEEANSALTKQYSSLVIDAQMVNDQVDEAIGKWEEDGEVSLTSVNQQLGAMDRLITQFKETGQAMPLEQAEKMAGNIDDITRAVSEMAVPDDVKQAILNYLIELRGGLDDVKQAAIQAGSAVSGVGGIPGGGTAPGGGAPIAMAEGGTITEPIVGRGRITGRSYLIGEDAPEYPEVVTPTRGGSGISSAVAGQPLQINIPISLLHLDWVVDEVVDRVRQELINARVRDN